MSEVNMKNDYQSVNEQIEKEINSAGKRSLQWSMVRMLLFGWLCPLFLLTILMSFFVTSKVDNQIERSTIESLEKAIDIMKVQLVGTEKTSKDASYQGIICDAYENYKKDGELRDFRDEILIFMKRQYQFDSYCRSAFLIFPEFDNESFYIYNNSMNGTYHDIEFFEKYVKKDLTEMMKKLDTKTELFSCDNRLYMARNLVDSKFRPYAVLVLEMESESLQNSFAGIIGQKGISIYKNGEKFLTFNNEETVKIDEEIKNQLKSQKVIYRKDSGKESHLYIRSEMYNSVFDYAISLDNTMVYAEKGTITYVFVILLIFMIPLMYMIFMFFHHRVNRPVQEMVNAFDMVRNGQYGVQIEEESDSEEFQYMKKSFNHMSMQLREQFEKIYKEEIALRDARIMALQSQINPHFLNNTLETINWEARLNENYKVSQMIEALSTMLEASMNRRSQPYDTLADEMEYVDAYLYIIKQRFGEKLQYQKEIDEQLLNVKIPKLVIQPIVENAVEHGMDRSKQGIVKIRIAKKDKNTLCIEVEDNGSLSEEDKKRIHTLLSEELNPLNEKHVSLGIRNVDRRLKILYGENFGLNIANNEENHTVSTILVKIDGQIEQ